MSLKSGRRQSELSEGNKVNHITLLNFAHILGDLDKAVCLPQGRDQSRSVTCEFGYRQPPAGLSL